MATEKGDSIGTVQLSGPSEKAVADIARQLSFWGGYRVVFVPVSRGRSTELFGEVAGNGTEITAKYKRRTIRGEENIRDELIRKLMDPSRTTEETAPDEPQVGLFDNEP